MWKECIFQMSNKRKRCILLCAGALVLAAIFAVILFWGASPKSEAPKIGFIMTGSAEDIGWNGMHYSGISAACDTLGAELLIKENIDEGTGQCAEAIKQLAADGAKMIVLSSYSYPAEAQSVIESYPDIAFYGISAEYYADNMTSFFGRMYQARYLAGIIAGMQTKTNKIGYVAAMLNSEVNRGINAFALGVKSVAPDAEVKVYWTGSWDDEAKETKAAQLLIEDGADVLAYHQNQPYTAYAADKAGVFSIGYNQAVDGLSDKYLTAAVWDYEELYSRIVKELLQGKPNSVTRHWFGIETGAVGLSELSPLVSEQTKNAVNSAIEDMTNGKDVFSGVIYDNNGNLRCNEDESISDDTLLTGMDWFVDGVSFYE